MKKMFMIALCIAACGFIRAQSPHVQFGLKGGLNIASLNVEDGVDYNSRTSFYLGGLAHIHVAPHIAIQPELFYSGQGGESGDNKLKLGYLNMPVLAQYMFGNGFRLQTGPQLGLMVSAENEDHDSNTDVKSDFKTVDFSWAIGASYQFPRSGAGIDARYNLGINNIYKGPADLQNRVFSLGVFYQFMK